MRPFRVIILVLLMSSTCAMAQSLEDLQDILDSPSTERNLPPPVDARNMSTGVSDLSKLEAFEDISVIQKRFLPKTSRFEGSFALGTVTNDPFFTSYNYIGRIGYYFTEAYGLELNFFGFMNSSAQVTEDLSEKRGVSTSGLVKPKMFYGIDFKWNPIYGKMTLFNNKIIPFDFYFSAGVGITQVEFYDPEIDPTSAPTMHFATGQVFALSKSTALRWDFSVNNLTAESSEGRDQTNNLMVSVGMSFFFPEASYR